ncbi:arginine-hydroxylase NDUFAF5, mitochondrial, partial [Chrysoperla carnea]|uniref:arginine-hydroxylase NDUFAF5, mitochondrial n=1 Tax=Chrysoperla carnea TaxID=189513 RepID=UPI001D063DC3
MLRQSRIWQLRKNFSTLSDEYIMNVFDRKAKYLQRERAAQADNVELYDYLKDEVGFRLADRVSDIKRLFKTAADIGCNRGFISKHLLPDSVEKLILCDMSHTNLKIASNFKENVTEIKEQVLDEEFIEFEENSLDLVISNLSLHWVNNLPQAFHNILRALKNDGVFMAAVFGGDTLFELRSSLQLAELERKGGISAHISPFTEIRDIGRLLQKAGFTMLTIDVDEIVVHYPSIFELMWDLKGMGENNAARNRTLHLSRDTQLAAAAIYQQLYGIKSPETTDIKVPATFQIIYMLGWKPDASQPKPLERGTGKISLKDLHRLDEIIKEKKNLEID